MRKLLALALFALFLSPAFADDVPADEAQSPDCEAIAKACLDGGYSREGDKGQQFWQDCMRPILFGKDVSGVTVDKKMVKSCRQFKIKNLQEQLKEFRNIKS